MTYRTRTGGWGLEEFVAAAGTLEPWQLEALSEVVLDEWGLGLAWRSVVRWRRTRRGR